LARLGFSRARRRLRRWLTWSGAALLALGLLLNHWVINNSEADVYHDWALLPENDVGLVLGTSPLTRSGARNPQFYGRIEAAVQLYQLGKIKHLIVSGANPDATYNEPRQMWRELTRLGVPSQAITMDFAGFRTLDSIARAQAVFDINSVTVITQEYHTYRAVFIGKKLHMQIVAYIAPGDEDGVPFHLTLREWAARIKSILDIYLLATEPKFLGEPQPLHPADEGH
jgi:SanA protein